MKKRILFVDDEPMLLDMYRLLFESEEAAWEIAFAKDGEEALDMMERAPFDVVVSEMNMTGMTGVELFAQVMKRFPTTSRVVVSEQSDQESVARELGAKHQFLAKPFDLNLLRSTLWRVCSLENSATDEKIKALMAQLYAVPSLPSLYFQIMRAMDDPNVSLIEVGDIIRKDPGMTAKILQLVNSAFFGIARRISNPSEAVQYLGVQKVRSLALSVHVFSCFEQGRLKNFSLQRIWSHSIAVGHLAQRICQLQRMDVAMVEEAYVAGMLHDVGKAMLASSDAGNYSRALALTQENQIPLLDAEKEIFGVTHAEVGAYLLGLWGLPIAVVEAIALHHAPGRSVIKNFSPLTAVHVASAIENEISGPAIGSIVTPLDEQYLEGLGLTDRLEIWQAAAADTLKVESAA